MPTELGVRFEVVDLNGGPSSLHNVHFEDEQDVEEILASLINQYAAVQVQAQKQYDFDCLIYSARDINYHWYLEARDFLFSPEYDLGAT
jgi:hypothetical protein